MLLCMQKPSPPGYPLPTSTMLMPEMSLDALNHVPFATRKKIAVALME